MKYSENSHNYGNKVPDLTLQVHNICLKKKLDYCKADLRMYGPVKP